MNSGVPATSRSRPFHPLSFGLLALSATVFGFLSGTPAGWGVVVALGAVGLGAALRWNRSPVVAAYAPVPPLAALVVEAVGAPVGFGTEIVAGLAAVAFLVWLADDPTRPVGGPMRGLTSIGVPTLALGIAWSSALFLPPGAFPLGVAGALLALTLAAVALLLSRPSAFDREEA